MPFFIQPGRSKTVFGIFLTIKYIALLLTVISVKNSELVFSLSNEKMTVEGTAVVGSRIDHDGNRGSVRYIGDLQLASGNFHKS